MLSSLRLLTTELSKDHPYNTEPPTEALLRLHAITEELECTQPTLPYNELLAEGLKKLSGELGLPRKQFTELSIPPTPLFLHR